MNTLIWILIASTAGSSTSPTVIATFGVEKDCLIAAATLERKSKDNPRMSNLAGICLPAQNTIALQK